MKINIFGSTGIIGCKTLKLIQSYFPKIKINLLVANKNLNLIIRQINKFEPKFVYIEDEKTSYLLRKKISGKKTTLIPKGDLSLFLNKTKSEMSLLAISGYNSLNYLEGIVKNTNNLGIVSKEAIVSAGHLFKKLKFFNRTNIFPIDSEHFSLFNFLGNKLTIMEYDKIFLTASGGPFLGKRFKSLKNIKFEEAIKHPKWNMGYKNSIDSATLVNKCLEIIEAHYLFDIPYKNIDILIHPQSIVHSIILKKNYVSNMVLFKNDMAIPLLNFLSIKNKLKTNDKLDYNYKFNDKLIFQDIKSNQFPIYSYFKNLYKINPINIIKFNIANEYALNLFKINKIKYTDIYKIIRKIVSLNLNYPTNNIKDILKFHEQFQLHISNSNL